MRFAIEAENIERLMVGLGAAVNRLLGFLERLPVGMRQFAFGENEVFLLQRKYFRG